jgi:cholesterol transport system auxiliary component
MKGLAMKKLAIVLGLSLALAGCVSLGKEPPPSLLTLTATTSAPAGLSASGKSADALAVIEPDAPQKLDVTRVPVQVDASSVAYLKDAVWVEKPARLFAQLIGETIRAKQTRLVIEGSDVRFAAATKLSGNLTEMGYDVRTSSVLVRFDAVLQQPDGQILTRRFESTVPGVLADPASVGSALNQAANKVAADVAAWIG